MEFHRTEVSNQFCRVLDATHARVGRLARNFKVNLDLKYLVLGCSNQCWLSSRLVSMYKKSLEEIHQTVGLGKMSDSFEECRPRPRLWPPCGVDCMLVWKSF